LVKHPGQSTRACGARLGQAVAEILSEPPRDPLPLPDPAFAMPPGEGRHSVRIEEPHRFETPTAAASALAIARALRDELLASGAFGPVWTPNTPGRRAQYQLDLELIDETIEGRSSSALLVRFRLVEIATGRIVLFESLLGMGREQGESAAMLAKEAARRISAALAATPPARSG
jgi:hypothetical protein